MKDERSCSLEAGETREDYLDGEGIERERVPYAKPELTRFGRVHELTRGLTGGIAETIFGGTMHP